MMCNFRIKISEQYYLTKEYQTKFLGVTIVDTLTFKRPCENALTGLSKVYCILQLPSYLLKIIYI